MIFQVDWSFPSTSYSVVNSTVRCQVLHIASSHLKNRNQKQEQEQESQKPSFEWLKQVMAQTLKRIEKSQTMGHQVMGIKFLRLLNGR